MFCSYGQVSMGNTIVKSTASKIRKIEKRDVVAGFAGSTADALTLFERLEAKIEKHAGNLSRAAVELAKDWRTDKYLRRLEALMAIGDKDNSYIISGTGDVLEPEGDVIGIGSGGNYALADFPTIRVFFCINCNNNTLRSKFFRTLNDYFWILNCRSIY